MPGSPLQFPNQPLSQNGGVGNYVAITDPTAANDLSQGYVPGSFWLNTSNSRVWMCMSNAAGAATWAIDGVVPGVGVEPSGMLTQFGGGLASFPEEGNVNRQISAAGIQPGATGVDSVLAFYSLPAGSFDVLGRGLAFQANGSFAATGNNKRLKLIFGATTAVVGSAVVGGTTICDSNTVATNGGGWMITGEVFKYGASGSNTQLGFSTGIVVGTTHGGLSGGPVACTAPENAPILIAVTGNATTAVSDIVFNFLAVNAMN